MSFQEHTYEYALEMATECQKNDLIDNDLYEEYGVNRGLRDLHGKGVVTGLTNISKIVSFKDDFEKKDPIDGQLWYRGYNVVDLIKNTIKKGFGYERATFLLIFGRLPSETELKEFNEVIAENRDLPTNFTRDVIMKAPTKDIMNSMTRSILTLASYDDTDNMTDIPTCIRQSLSLVATFPMLAVYAYHAYNHYENMNSMYIHRPDPKLSTAENILKMLRADEKYTKTEADVLDVCLMLHMEHGGGNNSTFTTRVVTSAGSDTYSSIAAGMCSLKGPKHGGANIKVMKMMNNIREHVEDWEDEEEVKSYLTRILDKEVFDKKGLIYGMGHAVYSISDPRERVLKEFVLKLVKEKNREKDLALYENIEKMAPVVIAEKRKIYKGVSPNVDFYSGFVYEMLGIPTELYTPLFAIARIAGWSAHRIEEMIGNGKIIRPAYLSVMKEKKMPVEPVEPKDDGVAEA
ncbi:MAG: citrate synthase [Lachnospiraceae bacterium]|nr:citrate synthase [Lachnospiraceae bacterium]